jgi:putative membrane protein
LRYKLYLLTVFIAVWAWSAYEPLDPDAWLAENYLVFFWVPFIILTGRYFKLCNISFTLITLFMCLHMIGAHYTYARVPFGETLGEWLGSNRNSYDRFVHFFFGMLIVYPVREVLIRIAGAKGFWGYFLPTSITLSLSAIYEIIEWMAAMNVPTDLRLAFLGTQGDIWDPQRDMTAAGLGAIVAMFIVFGLNLMFNRRIWLELRESLRIPARDRPLGEAGLLEWLRPLPGRKAGVHRRKRGGDTELPDNRPEKTSNSA